VAGSKPSSAAGARIEREGARVLVVSDDGRLLVLRGHDPHNPTRTWWFVPGGGLEGDETPLQAAARELAEETGIECGTDALVGPVWDRTAYFDFMSAPYVQHEVFYVLRVSEAAAPGLTAWTASEEETIDEVAWLSERQLREADIEVFPAELRQSWSAFLEWDGITTDLGEVDE
jgi:8-oxo-dGTP pyrophosphatase MutT (NUDIX family)